MPRTRRGRPPKLGDHQAYPLRMPVDLHKELRHYALDEGRSMNDVLVEVIKVWWDEQRPGRVRKGDREYEGREGRSKPGRLRIGSK